MAPSRVTLHPLRTASLAIVVLAWSAGAATGEEPAASRPGSTATAPPDDPPALLEILPPSPARSGRLRVETLVTTSEIRRVEFRLDGELIDQDRRFPFSTGVDAALCREARRLEAVGFDRAGAELARDVVLLEPVASSEFSISFGEVRPLHGNGWLEVTAEVRLPQETSLERVDFYRGHRYSGSVASQPFRLRIPRCDEAPFLRAVAHSTDGRLVESVHVLGGHADALSVSLIEIYAMVTDRSGRPVAGLEREMFELYHGSRSLQIERFTEGDAVPLSLALVIDSSGSMFDSMERAKGAARRFLTQMLDPDDEVLLVDFDHRPRLLAPATRQVDRLVERFGDIESDGASAVYDGIAFALLQLRKASARRALVVLTDGHDSGSRLTARQCARLARRSGVPIFVLRHPPRPSPRLSHHTLALEELADSTGGAVYPILSEDDVDAAYEAIERQLRGQYLLAFEVEEALSPDDLDALAVHLADERLRVRTILGGQVRLAD